MVHIQFHFRSLAISDTQLSQYHALIIHLVKTDALFDNYTIGLYLVLNIYFNDLPMKCTLYYGLDLAHATLDDINSSLFV